jgi:NAD dependent epimerase/dehydratase family enzyme
MEWEPAAARVDASQLEALDAVVHLAGDNIAAGRWSPAIKARIRDSRVNGTRFLGETLAKLERPPKVLVCTVTANEVTPECRDGIVHRCACPREI